MPHTSATSGPQSTGHQQAVLVVDLDGTLTPTDTLIECIVRALKTRPFASLSLIPALLRGRARFKERAAELAQLAPQQLPWRSDLIAFLTAERASGRRIVLATAAHISVATSIAQHLKLFDSVLATKDDNNLKGEHKLAAIRSSVGSDFVYAADSAADLPIWQGASKAILVGASKTLRLAVHIPIEREFPSNVKVWKAWIRALRPHQWVKNGLVFVPLLTAFAFADLARAQSAVLAFAAFCLAASATYLLNDILDVDSDRIHPRKRQRPFASGQLPMHHGLAVSALLFAASLETAYLVSHAFLAMLGGYVALTTLYSSAVKRYIFLDVLTLAILYTWRVLSGSIAVSITLSSWLFAFSVFTFLSLALVKRCSELVHIQSEGRQATPGRDYSVQDLAFSGRLGVGASLSSLVVFGLYVGSPDAAKQYQTPELLWLFGIVYLYWSSRIWIKTVRGEMHDDPIVFAFRNRGSRVTILAMISLVLAAHFIPLR